jgi:hypothetical protein
MDTEKLLRILKDIQQDEQVLAISTKIDAIRAQIAQNTAPSFESGNKLMVEFVEAMKNQSISYSFSRTENMILEKIDGTPYFGKGIVQRLQEIVGLKNFEIIIKLDEFKNQRAIFLNKFAKLSASLTEIGIENYRPDLYEVGLVLPEDQGDLDKLLKIIQELKLLLSAISEATGSKQEDVKITRVSNGSLELYSLQSAQVAEVLTNLMLNIGTIWDKIKKFRVKTRQADDDSDISAESKKKIKDIFKDETEKLKKEILETLPDKLLAGQKTIEKGRSNEIKNQIRCSMKAIFKWFEIGIEVDITPIRVPVPADTKSSTTEIEILKNIQDVNTKLSEVYKLPLAERKLPFELEAPDTVTSVENKKETTKKNN